MTHGSLFSGIGGFDLAAEWMGWENKFHCEWNEFGQKVLKHYWPKAKSYGDIKEADFTEWRGFIDVVSGGFPCQPYSLAGKRKGKEDDRHLWPQMLRAIREIQPRWVVGENVFGLINWSRGLVFHEVQTDLEAAGYEVWPYVLPACAKNAPHRRDRIWFIAHHNNNGGQEYNRCVGQKTGKDKGEIWQQIFNADNANGKEGITPNTDNNGQHRCDSKNEINTGERGENALDDVKPIDFGNPKFKGLQRSFRVQKPKKLEQGYKTNNWSDFPTQSPLCGRDDGLPTGLDGITVSKHRKESLMAYGNAIVPQVVYEIFKAIESYELISQTP